jgi:hypothetical protein
VEEWHGDVRRFGSRGQLQGRRAIRLLRYDAAHRVYLIAKRDESEYKGVLLDQTTGRILPAGSDVLFTDDGSRYLAISQIDGNVGESWHVYARNGRLLWEGRGAVSAVDSSMNIMMTYGMLDDPHWTATHQLEATANCFAERPKQTVRLVEKDGRYGWQEPSPGTISRVCAHD